MSASWKLFLSPKMSGQENMSADLKMFNDFEAGQGGAALRIYSWQPKCISVGYSQKMIEIPGWDCVRRPTGGGIVYHNEAEVTYSLVTALDDPILPQGLVASYKKISEAVVQALHGLGVMAEIRNLKLDIRNSNPEMCFSYPAEYEVVIGDRKIVGSAQKRGKKALLQQGSIFMKRDTICDMSEAICVEEVLGRVVSFEEMSGALVKGFEQVLGVRFEH